MQQRVCIIDPSSHMPGLKYLLPDAEYYAHEPDSFFTYVSTHHYTKEKLLQEYGFEYRTDWQTITSANYDVICLVMPFLDYYNVIETQYTPFFNRMLERIQGILKNSTFQKVALFDIYDYDYDPSTINKGLPIDIYFKRNYSKKIKYHPSVRPFPCSMFVKPCVMTTMLFNSLHSRHPRKLSAMWAGSLYKHVDTNFQPPIVRDRQGIYNKIKHRLVTYSGLSQQAYLQKIREHAIVVDLLGVGEPNKRTFEGFANGTLVMTMIKDLEWGFENGDAFHPDTIFETAEEFEQKLNKFLMNEEHYQHCLDIQNRLVEKYFGLNWMRSFLITNLGLNQDS